MDPIFEYLKFHEDQRCPPRYPSTDAYKCKLITYMYVSFHTKEIKKLKEQMNVTLLDIVTYSRNSLNVNVNLQLLRKQLMQM